MGGNDIIQVWNCKYGGVCYYTINEDGILSEPEYVRDTLVRYDNLMVTVTYGQAGPVFYTLNVYDITNGKELIRSYSSNFLYNKHF